MPGDMMNQNLNHTLNMRQKRPFRALAFLCGLAGLAALCASTAADPGGSPQHSNFSDTATWIPLVKGSGVQLTPVGQGFATAYAANTQPDPGKGMGIAAGYMSSFALRGDFTIDIDYALTTWPASCGVRLGLGVWPSICMIRQGQGPYTQEWLTFGAGPYASIPTADQHGTLRLVRKGGELLGYYRSLTDGSWVLVGSRKDNPVFTNDFQVFVCSWTDSSTFGEQAVGITLSNFVMTAGTVLPGPYGIPFWAVAPDNASPLAAEEPLRARDVRFRASPPAITSQWPSQMVVPPRRRPPSRPPTVIQPLESAPLPKGILEEDLNLDLNAAIQSYQSLITQFDTQRAMAANAIFRLAECYRRLGRTEEARSQYARILREFADQAPLVRLSRKYATSLTATPTAPPPAEGPSPRPRPVAGLVSRWAGEGNANDSQGSNHGILEGGVTFVPGEVGQAFGLDGTTADVRVPASTSLDVGAGAGMTMEAWIRPADLSDQHPVLEWNDGSFGTLLWVSVSLEGGGVGPGAFTANFKDVNLQHHVINSPPGVLTTNRFQHVAATYDGSSGEAALYLDGTAVAHANLGSFTPRTIGDLYFGLRPFDGGAGMRFKGQIDEVGVYNRALSAAEIKVIYGAGSAGKGVVTVAPLSGTATLEWQLAQARNELIKAKGQVAKAQALLAAAKAKLQEHVTSSDARASVAQAEAELDLGKAQESLWSQEVARLEARLKEQEQRGRGHEAVSRLKYQQAQAEFKRAQALRDTKAISESEYDAARLALEEAAADYPGAAESANKLPGRVYVSGEVKVQGPVDFDVGDNLTVSKAILRAGGFAGFANKKKVRVVRGGSGAGAGQQVFELNMTEILEHGNIEKDMPLQPGDYIIVPSRVITM